MSETDLLYQCQSWKNDVPEVKHCDGCSFNQYYTNWLHKTISGLWSMVSLGRGKNYIFPKRVKLFP